MLPSVGEFERFVFHDLLSGRARTSYSFHPLECLRKFRRQCRAHDALDLSDEVKAKMGFQARPHCRGQVRHSSAETHGERGMGVKPAITFEEVGRCQITRYPEDFVTRLRLQLFCLTD